MAAQETQGFPRADTMEGIVSGWEKLMQDLPMILSRMLLAGILVVIGVALLKFGRFLIKRAQKRSVRAHDDASASRQTAQSLFLSLFNYLMYFAISMAALSALGVDVSAILAMAGVGGVAIGFGCQTLVKDFVSGLFLWMDGRINVGDTVTVGNQTGTVENMALRTTTLRGKNGYLYTVPNGDIRTVINLTREYRCAMVDIMAAHGQDFRQIAALLQERMNTLPKELEICLEVPRVLGTVASDARGATFRIECHCLAENAMELEREIRLAALECYQKEGIKP